MSFAGSHGYMGAGEPGAAQEDEGNGVELSEKVRFELGGEGKAVRVS